jgi:hypothetical protein
VTGETSFEENFYFVSAIHILLSGVQGEGSGETEKKSGILINTSLIRGDIFAGIIWFKY